MYADHVKVYMDHVKVYMDYINIYVDHIRVDQPRFTHFSSANSHYKNLKNKLLV